MIFTSDISVKRIGWITLFGGIVCFIDYFLKKNLKTKIEVFTFLLINIIKRFRKILKSKEDEIVRYEAVQYLKLDINQAFLSSLVDGNRYTIDLFRREPLRNGVDAVVYFYIQEFEDLKKIPSQSLLDIHPRDIKRFLK